MQDKKPFYQSKRFWGIIVAIIGNLLPVINPGLTGIGSHIREGGELLFGYGCMDASKPIGFVN